MSDLSANINIQNNTSMFSSITTDISGISSSLSGNFANPNEMSGMSLIIVLVFLFLILPALVITLKLLTNTMDSKTAVSLYLSLLMFGMGLWYMIYTIQNYVLYKSKYKS